MSSPSTMISFLFQSNSGTSLDAEIGLNLVDLAQLEPSTLLLFDHRQLTAVVNIAAGMYRFYLYILKIYVILGSGHFYTNTDSDIVSIKLHKSTIDVCFWFVLICLHLFSFKISPKRIGKQTVQIHDLCIGDRNNLLLLPITVAEIDRILVSGPHFVSFLCLSWVNDSHFLGSRGWRYCITNINCRSRWCRIFIGKHRTYASQYCINGCVGECASVSIILLKQHVSFFSINNLTYRIHGVSSGNCDFIVSANQTNGHIIRNDPHRIHVFAALSLLPKHVVLIPESVFQVYYLILLFVEESVLFLVRNQWRTTVDAQCRRIFI